MKTECDFIPYIGRDRDGDLSIALSEPDGECDVSALGQCRSGWYAYCASTITDPIEREDNPNLAGVECPPGMAWLWRDHGFDPLGAPLPKTEPGWHAADTVYAVVWIALIVLAGALLMR